MSIFGNQLGIGSLEDKHSKPFWQPCCLPDVSHNIQTTLCIRGRPPSKGRVKELWCLLPKWCLMWLTAAPCGGGHPTHVSKGLTAHEAHYCEVGALRLPRTARCAWCPCTATFSKWYIKNRSVLKNIVFLSLHRGGPCWNCLYCTLLQDLHSYFFAADMGNQVFCAWRRTDGFSPTWAMSSYGLWCRVVELSLGALTVPPAMRRYVTLPFGGGKWKCRYKRSFS